MDVLFLIFDRSYVPLGELKTRNGAFHRFMVTREGEELLGEHIEEWQTRGILVVQNIERDAASKALIERRIQPRQATFASAFSQWAQSRGLRVLPLSEAAIPQWEQILHRPLKPMNRYRLIEEICTNAF